MSDTIGSICEPIACFDGVINDPPTSSDYFRNALQSPVIAETKDDLREVYPEIERGVILLEDGGIYKVVEGTHAEDTNHIVLNAPGYYCQRMNPIPPPAPPPPPPPARAAETYVNIKDYGGGNGINDDAALAEALYGLNPSCTIFFSHGEYRIDTTLNPPLGGDGMRIKGEGRQSTFLKVYGNITGVQFPIGPTGMGLEDISIYGAGDTKTAGYGFDFPGLVGLAVIRNVRVRNMFRGAGFSSTDYSLIDTLITDNNFNMGMHFRNDGLSGALQWQMRNSLTQLNDGVGCLFESLDIGPTQITMGLVDGLATYANKYFGIYVKGCAAVPMHDGRFTNLFIGNDGNNCLHFDSYGSRHQISNFFAELTGRGANGRNHGTAQTNVGSGLYLSANNGMVNLSNVHSEANSFDGIYTDAALCVANLVTATDNGQSGLTGRRNGIYHHGGELLLTGGAAYNNGAGAGQHYGIQSFDGNKLTVTGFRGTGNAINGIQINANAAGALLTGCRV